MNLDRFNRLSEAEAAEELARCCGSTEWVARMKAQLPFADDADLISSAIEIWAALGERDWLEAFSHHPKIGDVDSLKKKFAATADWAAGEQKGTSGASESVLRELKTANETYEKKFGFIFLICATGKSADEMLAALNARLKNDRTTELKNAVQEQIKITLIRLEKLP